MKINEIITEKKSRKKSKVRQARYKPGLYGGYGYFSNYGNSDSTSDGGGDGGGESIRENITPNTIHKLADRKGVKWDNEPSFLRLTKRLTGKEHLDDLDQVGLQKVKRHLDGLQGVAEGTEQSLSSMAGQDQAERNAYEAWVEAQPGATMGAEMGAKYAQLKNRSKLDIFGDAVRQDKFMKMKFDFDKFTAQDWKNYWTLAQHCDKNRDFQKNALSIIKKYQGEDYEDYQYLYDRISCGTTGKQKYGTQDICGKDKQGVAEGYATEDEQIDGMAQGEIREIIKNAIHIKNNLDKGISLDGWMYSYVTTSNDHLNSVAEQIGNPNIDEQAPAQGAETLQQKQVRAAITKGIEVKSQYGKDEYQSQPTKRNWFDPKGFSSDQLTGVDSIDPDGTVVISLGDTSAEGMVKKLAALGGMPGVKTRQIQTKVMGQGVDEAWSQKYKNSINCSHPKGFSQKAHCAGKKKHNESIEMEMVCEDCGMCETHCDHENLDEACWKGYHKEGNKKMFGKTYPNCVQNESKEQEKCPHCNGPMFSEALMNEKKDACYYKVKSRYKVWPSAYASGALVKCRKKGASNWGTGSKNESSILEGIEGANESLHDWFTKEKWVRMDTKGNIKGPCAKEPGEGKPKCLPQAKAHSLGKKGRASSAARKRREDPNPERSGKAINVATKKKTKG